MNKTLQKLLEQLVPFIMLGIGIALAIGLLIMFSYILIWGIMIGGVIWLIYVIKSYFSPALSRKKEKGRIIEHDNKD